MTVLLTRPAPSSTEMAARFASVGVKTLIDPLLSIVPIEASFPPPSEQTLVITSQHTLDALPQTYRPLPLLTVGATTTQKARDLGFQSVSCCGNTAEELLTYIQAHFNAPLQAPRGFLYLRGQDISLDVCQVLQSKGYAIESLVVYKANTASTFASATLEALRQYHLKWVPLFSVRTARVFLQLIEANALQKYLSKTTLVAYSPQICASLDRLPWHNIATCATPTMECFWQFAENHIY